LCQQGQRVVIVTKTHRFAGYQRIQRTKNGRMAKAFGDTACVERIESFLGGLVASMHEKLLLFRVVESGDTLPLLDLCL
jgi:hypothetical protein